VEGKHYAWIGLFSLIVFMFHVVHPFMVGTDSYYVYAFSCEQEVNPDGLQFLARLFFEYYPCDLLAYKFLSAIVLFVSSVIVAKTGELFDKKNGWLAGLLVFVSIAWVHWHIQIEDDLLGYPVLFLANYFMLKGSLNKSNLWRLIAIALVLFTGALIWKGALLYLAIYSFFFLIALITLFGVLYYIGFGAMHALIGNPYILENWHGLSFRTPGLGHGVGLLGLYLFTRKIWLFVPFLIFSILNVKWAVHLSPFLGLGLMFFYIDIVKNKHKIPESDVWFHKHLHWVPYIIGLVAVIMVSVMLVFQIPHANQMEASERVVELSEELNVGISNDWSYGYWIRYFGGVPNNEGGGRETSDHLPGTVVLTEEDKPECELLEEFGKGFNFDLKIYKC